MEIMFDEFHHFSSLHYRFSYFFVTLIPKVNIASSLGDFQSISSVGSLYKLVAKVLANRLEGLLDKLISSN